MATPLSLSSSISSSSSPGRRLLWHCMCSVTTKNCTNHHHHHRLLVTTTTTIPCHIHHQPTTTKTTTNLDAIVTALQKKQQRHRGGPSFHHNRWIPTFHHQYYYRQQRQQRWFSSTSITHHNNSNSSSQQQQELIYQDTRFLFQLTEQPDTTPLGSFLEQIVESSSRQNLEHWVGWWMTRHAMNELQTLQQQQQQPYSTTNTVSSSTIMLPEWFLTQTFCILHRLVEELEFYHSEMVDLDSMIKDDDDSDVDFLQLYCSGVNQLTHLFRAVLYPWLDAWKEAHTINTRDGHDPYYHKSSSQSPSSSAASEDDLIQVWNTLLLYETVIQKIMTTIHNVSSSSSSNDEFWNYWPIQVSAFDTLLDMVVDATAATSSSSSSFSAHEESSPQQPQPQQQPLLELVDAMVNFLIERQRRSNVPTTETKRNIHRNNATTVSLDPTWRTFHAAIQAWVYSTTPTTGIGSGISSSSLLRCTPQSLAAMNRAESLLQQMLETLAFSNDDDSMDSPHYDQAINMSSLRANQILTTFNVLLQAWSQFQGSALPNITQPTKSSNVSLLPSTLQGTVRVADRAEALMQQLTLMGNTNHHHHCFLQPNATSYFAILMAWAKNGSSRRLDRSKGTSSSLVNAVPGQDEEKDVSWERSLFWLKHQEEQLEAQHQQQQQHQQQPTLSNPVMTAQDYQVLIATYAAQGKVEESEYLLKYMTDLFVRFHDMSYCPTVRCYNTVINALANRRHEQAGIRAQELLEHLQDLTKLLLLEHQSNNLNNTSSDGGDDNSWIETWKPDVITYNSVLKAWVESGHSQAAQNCEKLLEQLISNEEDDGTARPAETLFRIKPDSITFTTVMDAWARQAERLSHPQQAIRAAERAEYWLRYVEENVASCNDPAEQTIMYNTVLKAWSSCQSPDRAQALLDELEQKGQPNRQSYGTLIHAWGRTSQHSHHAKAVFDKMLHQSQIVPDLSPTAIEYNSLINAWAKAGDPIAAEQVLRQMTDSQVQPDTISYTSVIQAWSQSGSAEAPERAQALLDDMEKSYRSQQQQQPQEQSNDTATRCKLQPDVRLYATIMNLFAKSRRPEQAQALYDKLKNRSDQEHLHKHSWIRPDLILFNSLLDAWAKVGNGQHAEQLLRNHVNGSSGFLPDTVSFNTVLAAWSRSQDDQAAPHAEAVFRWMQHLYQAQQLHCRPDSISFKSTMRAWSKSKQPDAFHRVLLLLSELQQHARSHNQQQQRRQVMQMDVETYVICLQALDRSQHLSNKEKTAHAQQLMHEMSQHGVQPTPQVLNLVGSCCQTQRRHQQRTDSNNSSNHDRPSQSKT